MPIEIITVFITVGLNALFWLLQKYIQKVLNKRMENADIEKKEADTDNMDSDTIQNLVDGMAKLNDLYEAQLNKNVSFAQENSRLSQRIRELEGSYREIMKQNEELTKKNAEMSIVLKELKAENEALRRLIVQKQIAEDC